MTVAECERGPVPHLTGAVFYSSCYSHKYYRPDPVNSKVDPGPGYRLLDKNEPVRKLPEGLPPGRMVRLGETLEPTDLFVNWPEQQGHPDIAPIIKTNVGKVATENNKFHQAYWRPDKPVKAVKVPEAKKTSKRLDPGKGYRLVKTGEVIRATDEVYDPTTHTWRPCKGSVGSKRNKYSRPIRRLRAVKAEKAPEAKPANSNGVDPGPGYRLLHKNELVEKGD